MIALTLSVPATPPHPIAATESPRHTLPVSVAAPSPAITPQPSSPATARSVSGLTSMHCPSWASVFRRKPGSQRRPTPPGCPLTGLSQLERFAVQQLLRMHVNCRVGSDLSYVTR